MNTAEHSDLRAALTFYASFDNGAKADFALGDPNIYNAAFPLYADPAGGPELIPGLGAPPLAMAPGNLDPRLPSPRRTAASFATARRRTSPIHPSLFAAAPLFGSASIRLRSRSNILIRSRSPTRTTTTIASG
jgi:hypothetical protein